MDFGPHAAFIWASYGVTALVLALLVIRAVTDERRQRVAIARLEEQGIRRRSDTHQNSGL